MPQPCALLFPQMGALWTKGRRIRFLSLLVIFKKGHAMFQSHHESHKTFLDAVQTRVSAHLKNGPVKGLVAFGLNTLKRVQRQPATACAYCGSSVALDVPNCANCGAGTPPPPPSAKAKTSIGQRVATGALWYFGGFLGLHCYPAGRPVRGLFYLVAFIVMLFLATSVGASANIFSYNAVLLGIGLTIMWGFDGIQIMRGRFAKSHG
jgi:hypothetical protein